MVERARPSSLETISTEQIAHLSTRLLPNKTLKIMDIGKRQPAWKTLLSERQRKLVDCYGDIPQDFTFSDIEDEEKRATARKVYVEAIDIIYGTLPGRIKQKIPRAKLIIFKEIDAETPLSDYENKVYKGLRKMADPEFRAKLKAPKSEETKEKIREAQKRSWSDPEAHERRSEGIRARSQDPLYRAKISQRVKEEWADPEAHERRSAEHRTRWENPEYRDKVLKKVRERAQDPEFRKKLSETAKAALKDPEIRAKRSEAMKKRWENPEYREWMVQQVKETKAKKKNQDNQQSA